MFKYLGSWFRADGSHLTDIKGRIVSATATAGKMRNVWSSKSTPLRLKLYIYKVGVCSKLTYGCEVWKLDVDVCTMFNDSNTNSRLLPHITGRTAHEEASSKLQTFDVLSAIRARRMKWLGHIPRMRPDRCYNWYHVFMQVGRIRSYQTQQTHQTHRRTHFQSIIRLLIPHERHESNICHLSPVTTLSWSS